MSSPPSPPRRRKRKKKKCSNGELKVKVTRNFATTPDQHSTTAWRCAARSLTSHLQTFNLWQPSIQDSSRDSVHRPVDFPVAVASTGYAFPPPQPLLLRLRYTCLDLWVSFTTGDSNCLRSSRFVFDFLPDDLYHLYLYCTFIQRIVSYRVALLALTFE